jgi:hypothetical protein
MISAGRVLDCVPFLEERIQFPAAVVVKIPFKIISCSRILPKGFLV